MASANFHLSNPGGCLFNLNVTMTLNEWKKVSHALSHGHGIVGHPLWQAINDMVTDAEKLHWKAWSEGDQK